MKTHRCRPKAVVLVGLTSMLMAPAASAVPDAGFEPRQDAQAGEVELSIDQLATLLGQAIYEGDEASRAGVLGGLRDLRDGAMRGVFSRLASCSEPLLRLHGVLGLAELDLAGLDDDAGTIDPLLIKRIPSSVERAGVLGRAIRLGLVGPEQCREISRWAELTPALRVLMLGELAKTGDTEALRKLGELQRGDELAVACLAWMHTADANTALEGSPIEQAMAMSAGARREGLAFILGYARQYGVPAGARVAQAVIDAEDDFGLRLAALATAVQLEPGSAQTAIGVTAVWDSADGIGAQARVVTALLSALSATDSAPSAVIADSMKRSDLTLASGAAQLCRALSAWRREQTPEAGVGLREAITSFAELGHAPSSPALAAFVGELDDAEAERAGAALLDATTARAVDRPGLLEAQATLGAELIRSRPGALSALVERSAKGQRSHEAELMLAGAAGVDRVSREALSSKPSRATTKMIALLKLLEPDPQDAEAREGLAAELANVAVGVGQLPERFRAQAAWRAIALRGGESAATARLLAMAP